MYYFVACLRTNPSSVRINHRTLTKRHENDVTFVVSLWYRGVNNPLLSSLVVVVAS